MIWWTFHLVRDLVKVGLPHHDLLVDARRREIVALLWEGDGQGMTLVSMQRVEDLALQQVEDLQRGVVGGGEQVISPRVKRHAVYGGRVARVVLDELVGPDVPYFDGRVGAAGGNEGAARMEGHAVDVAGVLAEWVDTLLWGAVPEFDAPVVGGAHD